MLAPFRLAKLKNCNWKTTFLRYTETVYLTDEERRIFRTVEDEIEEMERLNNEIVSNTDIQMDMAWLESIETSYITYIKWFDVVRNNFKFGRNLETELPQKFSYKNPITNEVNLHFSPYIEIYWLKYNVACINFAKGLINLQGTIKGKTNKFGCYFNRCEKILRDIGSCEDEKQQLNAYETLFNVNYEITIKK